MKIAMLASGGVDSSVSALILKNLGFDVTLFYIKVFIQNSFFGECPWEDDLEFVQKVAEQNGFDLQVINLEKEYFEKVVQYTLDSVKAGLTPNPDIFCNKFIKFGALFDQIDFNKFDSVATGHYASRSDLNIYKHPTENKFLIGNQRDWKTTTLLTPKDTLKDQTYFLSQISLDQLGKILFPLAELTKQEVRELAKQLELPNANRPDSQGICFLGKFQFRDFIKQFVGEKEGDIVELETDKVRARHRGFWYYTIGQREGIGLPQGPYYVAKKDTSTNTIYVSKNKPDLYTDSIQFKLENLITNPSQLHADELNRSNRLPTEFYFRVRHEEKIWFGTLGLPDNHGKVTGQFTDTNSDIDLTVGKEYRLTSEERFYTQAAGQFVALYKKLKDGSFAYIGGGRSK